MNLIDEIRSLLSSGANDAPQKFCMLLRKRVPYYNWVGIYILRDNALHLGPWDGPAATEHTKIDVGQGICGLAAREGSTVIVDDVNKDPRYLQCFLSTKSEIVVPIFANGKVTGEIDIDSDKPAAFNQLDRLFLEWCAELLSPFYSTR